MPVIFRHKSFHFFFYSNEGNPREAIHVHVRNGEGEAKFWLTPEVYLADSDGYDARTLRELREVVIDNRTLIEPRKRSWTRPSGLARGGLARRNDAAGGCQQGGATPPARLAAAQSGA